MLKFGKILLAALAISAASWAAPQGPAAQNAQSPPEPKTPAVFVPENRHRFPAVYEGVRVKHEFEIQNRGRVPLDIQKVRTG